MPTRASVPSLYISIGSMQDKSLVLNSLLSLISVKLVVVNTMKVNVPMGLTAISFMSNASVEAYVEIWRRDTKIRRGIDQNHVHLHDHHHQRSVLASK